MAIDIFQVGAQLGAPASKVSNVRYDNSGQQAVAREAAQTGRGVEAASEVAFKQMQNDDIAAVLDASNAMNMELINFFNGKDGILGRQGVNAEGTLKESEDFINKTTR